MKDLNSSTDLTVTRLLTVGVSQGGGGGGGGGLTLTPSLTGRSLFMASRHSTDK